MSGATVLYDAPGPRARRRIRIWSVVSGVVLAGVVAAGLWQFGVHGQLAPERWQPFTQWPIWEYLLVGLLGTLEAAAYVAVLSAVAGVFLALGRLSHIRIVRFIATGYIEIARTVPVLLMIYVTLFALPSQGINLPLLWKLAVPLTIANAAAFAEIFRAGILSLPRGQSEAALSLGLSRAQAMRLVVLPQAVRHVTPSLVSQLVSLLKDTSLGYIVAFTELLYRPCEHTRLVDGEARGTRGRDTASDAFEKRLLPAQPLGALAGLPGEIPSALDVKVDARAQLGHAAGARELRVGVEQIRQRRCEHLRRLIDGRDVRDAIGAQVVDDGAVVRHELLDDDARAARERLVLGLHAPHGSDGFVRRLPRDVVAAEQHRRYRDEAESEVAADAQAHVPAPRRHQLPQAPFYCFQDVGHAGSVMRHKLRCAAMRKSMPLKRSAKRADNPKRPCIKRFSVY